MNMMWQRACLFTSLILVAGGLAACTSLFGGEEIKVRPIENMSSLTGAPHDSFYESAVSAINARDYARALDYLQEARARDPRNVKALNALGVVYDKLGRFDLSARYYGQARAVEPESRIVAENIDYSKVLQGLLNPHTAVATVELPADLNNSSPEQPTMVVSASPIVAPAPIAIVHPAPVVVATAVLPAEKPTAVPVASHIVVARAILAPVSVVSVAAVVLPPVSPSVKPTAVVAASPAVVTRVVSIPERLGKAISASAVVVSAVSLPQKPIAMALVSPIAATRATPAQPGNTGSVIASAIPAAISPIKSSLTKPMVAAPHLPLVIVPAQHPKVVLAANRKILVVGQPIQILNASGTRDRVATVSRRLSLLGWTVHPSDAKRVQSATILSYPVQNVFAAKAMQRTLPFPVRLVSEAPGASAIRLVIGRDYLSWKPRNARLAALWQRGTIVASLQKPSIRGAR